MDTTFGYLWIPCSPPKSVSEPTNQPTIAQKVIQNMFTKKKKSVLFDNGNIAPVNNNNSSSPQKKSASSYDQFYTPSDKMSKSKMLSPPPPVPVPQPAAATTTSPSDSTVTKQLIFHCQLAHGSQTGFITGFSSVRELYQKIADYYEFPVEEVLN